MYVGNVFHDLEIDTSGFLDTEQGAKNFATAVFKAAADLESIMDEKSTPASQIVVEARRDFKENPQFKQELKETFQEGLDTIYTACEELPLPIVVGMVDALRQLANDLENTLNDRSKRESMKMSEALNDKKVAQIQHKRLRENWDNIRKVMKLMFDLDFPAIKSKPGNYAMNTSETYGYFFPGHEDDEPFFNPFYIARKLGIYYHGMTMMDVMEYCEKHPEEIIVKKVNMTA